MTIWAKLSEPFQPDIVSWRIGSTTGDKTKGMALAYIDARDVAERLDAVVGPANWQNRYSHAEAKTICEIGLRVDGEWIWKADGAGDTDTEAEKGALSDAFKRAAVRFGIGRYLYDVKNSWVEIEPAGKSYKIKAGEYAKLRGMLPGPPSRPKLQTVTGEPAAPKAQSREPYDKISKGIRQIESTGTNDDLTAWYKAHVKTIETFETSWHQLIMEQFSTAREALKAKAA